MDKKLNEEIIRIKQLIKESDIRGIDELVYNPLTGPGKPIGFGYDRGVKQVGITWDGHDDHLHIGFTDRTVAMEVIDKADSMGLKTTENPYAKKDPNGKVDAVHTKDSFHYKTFPGNPPVGGAVDISGDMGKIEELIIWVNQEYAGVSVTPSESSDENKLLDKILKHKIGGKTVKDWTNISVEDLGKLTNTGWKALTDLAKYLDIIKFVH